MQSEQLDRPMAGEADVVATTNRRWTRRGLAGLATGMVAVVALGGNDAAAAGGKKIVKVAKRNLNGVYVAGGTGKKKNGARQFDCSGFTSYCVKKGIGKSITPALPTQASVGKKVSQSKMAPGDLMYFSSGGKITHCAIYMGNGRIIHAMNPKLDVKVSKLSEFNMKVAAIRRVV